MTEPAQVLYETSAGVAVVTLNRPDRLNAWTARMAIEFSAALERAEHDDDVGAVVITGAGRAFCAGLDLGESPSFDAGDRPEPKTLPWHLGKPVVAAVNGHAIGVGATLALTADLRFISSAAKVQFPFVRLGLVSELGSHASLPRIVGHEVASDLLLSGRMIVGTEAADLGLRITMPRGGRRCARSCRVGAGRRGHDLAPGCCGVEAAVTRRPPSAVGRGRAGRGQRDGSAGRLG